MSADQRCSVTYKLPKGDIESLQLSQDALGVEVWLAMFAHVCVETVCVSWHVLCFQALSPQGGRLTDRLW